MNDDTLDGLVLWYLPAAPGATAPERDVPGPACEPPGPGLPPRRRPAGVLLAAPPGAAPLAEAARLCGGRCDPCGTPQVLTARRAAAGFGEAAVRAAAGAARGREAALAATPPAVRRAAAGALAAWMDSAAASAPGEAWTGVRRAARPLAARYGGRGPARLRVDASAPHEPGLRPRPVRVLLEEAGSPAVEVCGLGAGGPAVRIAGRRCEMPLRDLETACLATARDAAGVRPRAPRLAVLAAAGRLAGPGARLTLWVERAGGENWTAEAGTGWLFERLCAASPLRDQQGADPYDERRPWELDVRLAGGEPAVVVEEGPRLRLLRGGPPRWLAAGEAADVRAAAGHLRPRCGADRFWTDAATPQIEGLRPAARPEAGR